MELKQFFGAVQAELNDAVSRGWLKPTDFDDHGSCYHSKLHARVLGLLTWVLQNDFDLWVEHERRLGGAQHDLLAYSNEGACEALIEYESPNSYLPVLSAHVGKDIKNYFNFHKSLDTAAAGDGPEVLPKRWIVITSLPTRPVQYRSRWKYRGSLGNQQEQEAFLREPFAYMYDRYQSFFDEQKTALFPTGFTPKMPLVMGNIRRAGKGGHLLAAWVRSM